MFCPHFRSGNFLELYIPGFTGNYVDFANGWRAAPLFFKPLNAGFNLGADLIYTEDYFLGLRYYLGMTDLLSSAKRPPISNTCWTISVGYLF